MKREEASTRRTSQTTPGGGRPPWTAKPKPKGGVTQMFDPFVTKWLGHLESRDLERCDTVTEARLTDDDGQLPYNNTYPAGLETLSSDWCRMDGRKWYRTATTSPLGSLSLGSFNCWWFFFFALNKFSNHWKSRDLVVLLYLSHALLVMLVSSPRRQPREQQWITVIPLLSSHSKKSAFLLSLHFILTKENSNLKRKKNNKYAFY